MEITVIIAGWSTDGGWLPLGHAVRMAFEISMSSQSIPDHLTHLLHVDMHKTWPRLLRRIKSNKLQRDAEERELVISTRTWLTLYVFEHQYVRSS